MSNSYLKNALRKLKKRRELVAWQLDKAYQRNDMSLYLSLEERYKRLAHTIDRLLHNLRSNGIKPRELERF